MADTKLSAVATEATPSVGDERLYGVQNLAGSPTSVYHKLGDVMYYGASAPSTPEAGFLWHETDTGIIWRYGTYASASRWVSAVPQTINIANATSAKSAGFFITAPAHGFPHGYDIYIESLFLKGHVITTNNGSNYWKWDLRYVTGATVPASAAGTSIGSVTTSAESPNVLFFVASAVDAIVTQTGATPQLCFTDVTKSGSPGNIWDSSGVLFRLVHA